MMFEIAIILACLNSFFFNYSCVMNVVEPTDTTPRFLFAKLPYKYCFSYYTNYI